MTTNETSFFRDHHLFDALRRSILPDLIQKREGERKLDIWCAASSSGQEPYTIAMVLREYFPELCEWTVGLVATDISTEMLNRARTGRFDQLEVNRGLPAPMLVKYFLQHGSEWQLKDEVRQMVEFRPLNLVKAWPGMPPVDLVFLRNVMLYFDVESRRQILGRIRQLLQPDGYLFLGATETTLNTDDAFERVAVGSRGRIDCGRRRARCVLEQEICRFTRSIWSLALGLEVERAELRSASEDKARTREDAARTLAGCVHIGGAWEGALVLYCHPLLASFAAAAMFGCEADEAGLAEQLDAVGEIANMMGGTKAVASRAVGALASDGDRGIGRRLPDPGRPDRDAARLRVPRRPDPGDAAAAPLGLPAPASAPSSEPHVLLDLLDRLIGIERVQQHQLSEVVVAVEAHFVEGHGHACRVHPRYAAGRFDLDVALAAADEERHLAACAGRQ
jgi:chemotaxis protein methyltransferase CheR